MVRLMGLVGLLAALAGTAGAQEAGKIETAEEVIQQMEKAREGIKTAYYKWTTRVTKGPVEKSMFGRGPDPDFGIVDVSTYKEGAIFASKYEMAFSGPKWRHAGCQLYYQPDLNPPPGETTKLLIASMEILSVFDGVRGYTVAGTDGRGEKSFSIRSDMAVGTSLSESPLFLFHYPREFTVKSSDKDAEPKLVGRAEHEGASCYVLRCDRTWADEVSRNELYVDPAKGWNIVRRVLGRVPLLEDGTPGEEFKLWAEFRIQYSRHADKRPGDRRPGDGGSDSEEWLPSGWESTLRISDCDQASTRLTLVEINRDLPSGTFDPPMSDGSSVYDAINEVEYIWRADRTPGELAALVANLVAEREQKMDKRLRRVESVLQVGQDAPAWQAEIAGGGRVALADLKGKHVVLALWCMSCGGISKEEAGDLIAVYTQFKDDPRVKFMSLDHDNKAARKRPRELGIEWDLGLADLDTSRKITNQYGVTNRGWLFLIGPGGKVLKRNIVPAGLADILTETLKDVPEPAE